MRKKFPRIIELVQEQIRFLVANNELNTATKLLVEVTEALATNSLKEALILSGGIASFETELREGLIDRSTASQERNKFFSRILNITENLSSQECENK